MIKEIIILFGILGTIFAANLPFFRRDYHYDRDYDAFYKVHLDARNLSYEKAVETCIGESSKIFYPKFTEEWKILRPLIELRNPDVPEYILVGFYNEIGVGQLITVDGRPTPVPLVEESDNGGNCVYMNIDNGSTSIDTCPPSTDLNVRGFICKREIEKDQPCPTIDREYHYDESTNKCYKLNKKAKTWLDAMTTCFMEGGSLLVTKNNKEKGKIFNFLTNRGVNTDTNFFVGYRKSHYNNQFYTVKGESLVDGFYVENNDNGNYENNDNGNYDNNNGETIDVGDCGIYYFQYYNNHIIYDRKYPCELALPFICEIPIN